MKKVNEKASSTYKVFYSWIDSYIPQDSSTNGCVQPCLAFRVADHISLCHSTWFISEYIFARAITYTVSRYTLPTNRCSHSKINIHIHRIKYLNLQMEYEA